MGGLCAACLSLSVPDCLHLYALQELRWSHGSCMQRATPPLSTEVDLFLSLKKDHDIESKIWWTEMDYKGRLNEKCYWSDYNGLVIAVIISIMQHFSGFDISGSEKADGMFCSLLKLHIYLVWMDIFKQCFGNLTKKFPNFLTKKMNPKFLTKIVPKFLGNFFKRFLKAGCSKKYKKEDW